MFQVPNPEPPWRGRGRDGRGIGGEGRWEVWERRGGERGGGEGRKEEGNGKEVPPPYLSDQVYAYGRLTPGKRSHLIIKASLSITEPFLTRGENGLTWRECVRGMSSGVPEGIMSRGDNIMSGGEDYVLQCRP